jgi:hypothetical protein
MTFSAGCSKREQIPLVPQIGELNVSRVLPFRGAFYVSEKTKMAGYRSPEYIPWQIIPNTEKIRPFEIQVGRSFTTAAFQAFSQVLEKLTVVEGLPAGKDFQVIIEPLLETIDLQMIYLNFGNTPNDQMLDVGGFLEAKLRLTRRERPAWEKIYRVPITTQRILVNPWTGERIAEMVADALSSLVREMALEMAGAADKPVVPLNQWLQS